MAKTTADYPQDDVKASWEICDSTTLKRFSAVGYFFGKNLQKNLNVPIGLINSSWGGTPAEVWVPDELVNGDEELDAAAKKLRYDRRWPILPGKAFNAMIAPLTPYQIAGSIWYQGESNANTNSTYEHLMKVLIDSWRKEWQKEFPFYLVQIAPYKYGNHNIGALIQEAQTKLMSHPKTGTVIITDLVNDINNIHPTNKHDVGARLANWALAETYGRSGVSYKSPQFKSMEVVKDKAVLTFSDCPNGLISNSKSITGFYISGEKEQWFPADAKIEGNKIIVSNKNVATPAQVRFGFGNTIIGNVFSKEGLPLTPFRTDSWAVDQTPLR
jgi:sialate O-acetylesterase